MATTYFGDDADLNQFRDDLKRARADLRMLIEPFEGVERAVGNLSPWEVAECLCRAKVTKDWNPAYDDIMSPERAAKHKIMGGTQFSKQEIEYLLGEKVETFHDRTVPFVGWPLTVAEKETTQNLDKTAERLVPRRPPESETVNEGPALFVGTEERVSANAETNKQRSEGLRRMTEEKSGRPVNYAEYRDERLPEAMAQLLEEIVGFADNPTPLDDKGQYWDVLHYIERVEQELVRLRRRYRFFANKIG